MNAWSIFALNRFVFFAFVVTNGLLIYFLLKEKLFYLALKNRVVRFNRTPRISFVALRSRYRLCLQVLGSLILLQLLLELLPYFLIQVFSLRTFATTLLAGASFACLCVALSRTRPNLWRACSVSTLMLITWAMGMGFVVSY